MILQVSQEMSDANNSFSLSWITEENTEGADKVVIMITASVYMQQ